MKLTLRDKHLLRRMLAYSSVEIARRCDSTRQVEERSLAFERVIKKLVPLGELPKLKKPLWEQS